MTSTRESWQNDSGDELVIELQELILVRSLKTHDLYRVACRLAHAGDVLGLVLDVKDDCVFVGEVAPLIKHSIHVAFAQLAHATFSKRVDDSGALPQTRQRRWHFDLQSLRRDDATKTFAVEFGFRGSKKAAGHVTLGSSSLDDGWRAEAIARGRAHDIFTRAFMQTQAWELSYEELQEL